MRIANTRDAPTQAGIYGVRDFKRGKSMPKDPDVPQAPSTTEPPARSPEPLDESERRLIDARLDLLGSVKAQPPGPPGA